MCEDMVAWEEMSDADCHPFMRLTIQTRDSALECEAIPGQKFEVSFDAFHDQKSSYLIVGSTVPKYSEHIIFQLCLYTPEFTSKTRVYRLLGL
jgi:hypothetical protein